MEKKTIAVIGAIGAQGKIAIEAAKAGGVKHFIWSTLPNIEAISGGNRRRPIQLPGGLD